MHADLLQKLHPCFDEIEFIGEGVTSKVFRAREKKTGTAVALKILNPHLATDSISIERFKREIRIAREIQHPQVIAIYDLVTRDEPYYLVMEFVDGLSLKDYIRLHSPLPIETVVSILTQLFDALSLCHSKNVIHRDLKPQNVMITAEGAVKILDFGIARMTALTDLTQTGTSLGSPEYMAPELFATNAYEPRSDLYAVGVMTYEMLSGELPFQGDTLAVLFHKHLKEAVPDLSCHRQDIPRWLQQVIEKLLAKKAHQRYQSALDVLTDLRSQRVLSCSVPVLQRRVCLACGEETPAASTACFLCGEDGSADKHKGSYYITCESQQDPDRIKCFFADCFEQEITCSGKPGTVFMLGIDETYLGTIKKAAQRYGIHLVGKSMRRRSLVRLITVICMIFILPPLVITALKGAVQFIVVAAVNSSSPGEKLISVVYSLVLAVAILCCIDICRKNLNSAVLCRFDVTGGKLAGLEWFNRLGPLLKGKRSEAMQQLVTQTLERFLLFDKHAKKPAKTVVEQIRKLLMEIVPVANYLSGVEPRGKGEELAKLMREHALKTRNNGDLSALELTIREIFNEEDNYSLMLNRFTEALALFNRLIGMAIVFDMKVEEQQLEVVSGQIRELGKEIEVWKRVKGELAGDTGVMP